MDKEKQEHLLQQKNELGFTAFEQALLLGEYETADILKPRIMPQICITKKASSTSECVSRNEFSKFFGITYRSCLYFEDVALLEEVVRNCPWMLRTFMGDEHRSLAAHLRKKLFGEAIDGISVEWINETIGYGLFARRAFKKDEFVGEYVGKVRKCRRFSPELNGYCMHLPSRFWSFHYYVIDAESDGNEMRFANHSDEATMRPISLLDRNLLHVGLFAKRDIEPGEELTFNYGKDYWQKRKKSSQ